MLLHMCFKYILHIIYVNKTNSRSVIWWYCYYFYTKCMHFSYAVNKHNKEDLNFEGVGVVFVEPILTGFESVADLEALVLDLPPGQL